MEYNTKKKKKKNEKEIVVCEQIVHLVSGCVPPLRALVFI